MRQTLLFLSSLLCAVIILSCNNISQKKFEFYYYPERNVYYDVTNSMYLYSLDGGKTWDSINIKTNKEPQTLGEKKIIYSTTPEIWLSNQQHIVQYSGQVVNIIKNDSSLSEADLAADRKLKKSKSTITNSGKQEPEKKPGFFQRLFGKKHK